MLKVECESCKAPYQIDERRVPAAGLKMRCPKCGHSFVVTKPAGDAPAASALPVPPAPAPFVRATKPEGMRAVAKTMLGVAPAASAASAPAPAAPAAAPAAAGLPPMRPELPSDFPAVLGSLEEDALPVVGASLPSPVPKKAPPAAAKAAPAASAAGAKPTMPARPVAAPPKAAPAMDLDLPAVAQNLPAVAARPAARAPSAATGLDADLPAPVNADLPARAGAGLPAAKRAAASAPTMADLPAVAAGLPAVSAGLPSVSASLPSVSASLPSVSASLPSVSASLPSPAAALPKPVPPKPMEDLGFGEIELPIVGEGAPATAPAPSGDPFGDFGELDLPGEQSGPSAPPAPRAAPPAPPPPAGPQISAGARRDTFGELDFEGSAAHRKSTPPAAIELDDTLGFGDPSGPGSESAPPMEAPIPSAPPPAPDDHAPQSMDLGGSAGPMGGGGFEAAIPMSAAKTRERPQAVRKSTRGRTIGLVVVAALVVGAGALELTPYGAFGRNFIADKMNAQAYVAAANTAAKNARTTLATDTYDDAKTAVEQLARAHAATERSRPLTTYAAFADFAVTVRFGVDGARAAHGAQWLRSLPPNTDVPYLTAALAAQAAAGEDWDKARKGLDAASKKDSGDGIQLDIALLRGEVELRAKDPAAALAAFQKAAQLAGGPSARAQYGLARAYDAMGNRADAKKAADAVLAASPAHAGARILRATLVAPEDDAAATKDIDAVLADAAQAKASPMELAEAHAQRGWMSLGRGGTNDARAAFELAVKLNPRSIAALTGQGELFFREGRYTEALTRFETALQADKDSVLAITLSVKTQIALERLSDAKNLLTAARARFPKEMLVALWLGNVEGKLNNAAAAEQNFRAALLLADPARRDAVLPYVWLSALLASQAKVAEAQAVLDDARKKLPDSAALQRALGEVSEAQSSYDDAAQHYRAAIAKEPTDASTHFRLGATLRKMRRFDEAAKEFDVVEAADKDFPGLAIERGQLFEESGDVGKAIEQFKAALAKAPNDPDLQLRVGSAYVLIARPDDAIPQLKKVLEKRATSAEAHHYLGRAYMERGKSGETEALRELRKAVDLDPNRAEFHFYLAWAADEMSPPQVAVARDETDKAIALDKAFSDAWWLRGLLECRSGQLEDGTRDVRKSIVDMKNQRPEPHAALAECLELKNDPRSALGEWGRAVNGDPKRLFWQYRYGKLLFDQGSSGEAAKHLQAAATGVNQLEVAPGWAPQMEFALATSLRKNGNKADAITHYQRYLKIAPTSSPDYKDAAQALEQLGGAPR